MFRHGFRKFINGYFLVVLDQVRDYHYAEIQRAIGASPQLLASDGNWYKKIPDKLEPMRFKKRDFNNMAVQPDYWLDRHDFNRPVYYVRYKVGDTMNAWEVLPDVGRVLPAPTGVRGRIQ